jgi:hypothetical protein
MTIGLNNMGIDSFKKGGNFVTGKGMRDICAWTIARNCRWHDSCPSFLIGILDKVCHHSDTISARISVFSRTLATPIQHFVTKRVLIGESIRAVVVKEMKVMLIGVIPSSGSLPIQYEIFKQGSQLGSERSVHNIKASSATGN